MVNPGVGKVGFHRIEEALPVLVGLEAYDIGAGQRRANPPRHVRRDHLPEPGFGPRYVDEVLDDGVGNLLPYHFRHQVQVIVVADDNGRFTAIPGLADHLVGEGLVYRHIAAPPPVVDGGVHVGVVGRVPHVVLQEPE